MIGQNYSFSNG